MDAATRAIMVWSSIYGSSAPYDHRARPFYPFPAARSTSECENSRGPAGAGRSGKKISYVFSCLTTEGREKVCLLSEISL
jgi:hypothetical protein